MPRARECATFRSGRKHFSKVLTQRVKSKRRESDPAMSASLIGRSGSSAFRLSTMTVSMSPTGLALLFGIGTTALPSWGSKTRWNDPWVGLVVSVTAGPSGHANSPHPSSREGHHTTARWSSSFLLSDLILHGSHAVAASLAQRNSAPSTHMRCMITASRRASASMLRFLLLMLEAVTTDLVSPSA
jgi:hypothetical protein